MDLSNDIMYQACLEKDTNFEGKFITAVITTGIFCRPTCTARKPKKENVRFYKTADEAINNGFRACKVCRPLADLDAIPKSIANLFNLLKDESVRLKDNDLISMGLEPHTVRRWFLKNHQMTFHGYQRKIKIAKAINKLNNGWSVNDTAFSLGYESLSGFADAFKIETGMAPKKYINKE